ncbi:MAG: cation-translocating P-type ATPase [Anaerolineae bacterium]|nr:cation-translocating P-type ATPase [Anaerolineae bacterium]
MPDFYRMTVSDTIKDLNTSQETGLSETEVKKRLEQYGLNALPRDEGINWFELIWGQFNDPLIWLLIFAAVVSAFLGEVTDMIVITIIVVLNAALGIYQEFQAEQALAALSAMQVPQVTVRREGKIKVISAEQLVPGDIVLLEEGVSIPADGRLLEVSSLRAMEAALTGESVPVGKKIAAIEGTGSVGVGDRKNMVFMGTTVNFGRGLMVVTTTGLKTELGEIADLLTKVEKGETPLQRRLAQLGSVLFWAAIVIVAIVFFVGWRLQGIPPQEMFLIAVSLAVAAVPEGLPALVTIGLSLGAGRMIARNALIRRLPAVETLGSVTVICSDKTGTLTRNEMTATYFALPRHDDINVEGIGYTPEGIFTDEGGATIDPKADDSVGRFIKAMALSTNAYIEHSDGAFNVVGDTTEGAMVVAAQKVGWTREQLEADLPRINEFPFSSERKAMTTVHNLVGEEAKRLFDSQGYISITKGAPDRLIGWATEEHIPSGRLPLSDERRQAWHDHVNTLAGRGLRVLGIAYRPLEESPQDELDEGIERELVLLGLVGIVDPARPEAKIAVKTAREAGIRSIMITGDHALTAESIARDLGILGDGQRAITGSQLDEMSDAEISKALDETSCFARVSPTHKLKLVKILQDKDNIAAMTGDGVNDAPALKQADIGVAMGITGTDVSKGAAAMVLTDDNFASIVAAIEEGRAIYDNIKKFIKYLLSSNVGEILVMFIALLVGLPVPLLAIQILWINLVTDGLPAIALGFEPAEEGVMRRKPRPKKESIFAGGVGRHIVFIGLVITVLTLGGYVWGFWHNNLDLWSDTHGIENLTGEELVALIGEDITVPNADGEQVALTAEYWDSIREDEAAVRIAAELHDADEEVSLEEEANETLIGHVERIPRSIAFTILAFTQMFEVMAIHAGNNASFFRTGFKSNRLLFWAVLSTFALQIIVLYVPFMQESFETVALSGIELLVSFLLGAVVLFAVEIEKYFNRHADEREFAKNVEATQA